MDIRRVQEMQEQRERENEIQRQQEKILQLQQLQTEKQNQHHGNHEKSTIVGVGANTAGEAVAMLATTEHMRNGVQAAVEEVIMQEMKIVVCKAALAALPTSFFFVNS